MPTELAHLTRREKKENVRLACQLKVKENLKIRVPEEIFNIKKYNATIIFNDNVATFIKELVIQLDSGEELAFYDLDEENLQRGTWQKIITNALKYHP